MGQCSGEFLKGYLIPYLVLLRSKVASITFSGDCVYYSCSLNFAHFQTSWLLVWFLQYALGVQSE